MPAHRKYIEKVDRVCPVCDVTYKAHPVRLKHGRETTCSRACSYKLRANTHAVERVVINCPICGRVVRRLPDRANRPAHVSTCSRTCKGKAQTKGLIPHRPKPYKRGPAHALWDGGSRHRYYGGNWKAARRAARRRDQYTCRRCGIHERKLGRRVQVHHIVPLREFANPREANVLTNLECLCAPCHAKTEVKLRAARRSARA